MTPGKGGQTALDGSVPVFDTVAEAVRETGANTSLIFVPAAGAPDAVMEAAAAGIGTIFCITEGIPALDMVPAVEMVRAHGRAADRPELPGRHVARAGQGRDHPGHRSIARAGSASSAAPGTLTYEAVQAMTDAGLGQSTCVGIGGDPIIGTTFLDVLQLFAADDETDAIVLIGEIGGAAEETAAAWAAEHLRDVPKVAFIAGRTAPEGKRMGHAGAIISGGAGHGGVQGRRARGRRVPRRRLTDRAARPPARRRLPRLSRRQDGRTDPMRADDVRFLFAFDRWATARILAVLDGIDEATWSAADVVDERGLGGILVHHLGASQRWRHGLLRDDVISRPEREPLPTIEDAASPLGGRVGRRRRLAAATRRCCSERGARGRRRLEDARPRGEPRHPAPHGSRRDPHRDRPLTGRPRPHRLRRGAGRRRHHGELIDAADGAHRRRGAGHPRRARHGRGLGRASTASGSRPTCRSAARSTRPGWTCSPSRPASRPTRRRRRTSSTPASSSAPRADALTIERVDPAWISAIARLSDTVIDAVTGRWIDLIEEEIGELPREEKPWIRQLAGEIVGFCRIADRAPDVVFVWALG